jgi:hypothetical protein
MQIVNCNLNKAKNSSYNWSDFNPFVPAKAEAQATKYVDDKPNVYNANTSNSVVSSASNVSSIGQGIGQDVLPVPVLLVLFMFIVFIFIMSIVYVYHWTQFSLGDKFIKNATAIYFIGLILLSLPLLLFLI